MSFVLELQKKRHVAASTFYVLLQCQVYNCMLQKCRHIQHHAAALSNSICCCTIYAAVDQEQHCTSLEGSKKRQKMSRGFGWTRKICSDSAKIRTTLNYTVYIVSDFVSKKIWGEFRRLKNQKFSCCIPTTTYAASPKNSMHAAAPNNSIYAAVHTKNSTALLLRD